MPPSELREVVLARGHPNISATHPTTLEITKQPHLTVKGDCIIAVAADKAIDDLAPAFLECLRRDGASMTMSIRAGGVVETVRAAGSSRLILDHPTDIVIRRSSHVSGRTLAVDADRAACDLSRALVEKLRDSKQRVRIVLSVTI